MIGKDLLKVSLDLGEKRVRLDLMKQVQHFFNLSSVGLARLAKEAILGPILGENVPLGGCVRISSEGFGGKQYG